MGVPLAGSGFDPDATVVIAKYGPTAWLSVLPAACDSHHVVTVRADATGSFTSMFPILVDGAPPPFAFTPDDQSVTWPPADGAYPGCVVVAFDATDPAQRSAVPVSLNRHTVAVVTTTTVVVTTTVPTTVSTTRTPPPSPLVRRPLALTGAALASLAGVGALAIEIGWLLATVVEGRGRERSR